MHRALMYARASSTRECFVKTASRPLPKALFLRISQVIDLPKTGAHKLPAEKNGFHARPQCSFGVRLQNITSSAREEGSPHHVRIRIGAQKDYFGLGN